MKKMFRTLLGGVVFAGCAVFAQVAAQPGQMSAEEQDSLRQALGEAGNSPIDFLRALEAHLQKFPNSPKRLDLERALVKTAIDVKDNDRIIRFGEDVLQHDPDNVQMLQSVTVALLQTGGKMNAELALKHAERLERVLKQTKEAGGQVSGRDAARLENDRERGEASAVVLQARAHGLLGQTDTAVALAQKSYEIYASVEAAREAARWLAAAGKDREAIEYLANAFTIAELHAADPQASLDRQKMGELYRKLNGSETGLGDVVLKAYDRTSAQFAARREKLREMDPNAQVKDPLQFTITGLSGEKLQLAGLKGKVIVMDFWATWCGPCRAQHPLYEEAKQRFKNRDDVVFLSIDTDDDHSQVKPFLEANQWKQKVYFEDGLGALLQVSSIPMTLIFNKKGEVYSRMNGFIPERFVDMLSERILEALGEKKAAAAAPSAQ